MKIFVINLDRSAERWDAIKAQLDKLALTDLVARFPAIDGASNDVNAFWPYVDQRRAKQIKGRELSEGQIGCFASHYTVWQRIAASSQGAIVLEDDVGIAGNFKDFIDQIAEDRTEFCCIRLFANKTRKARAIRVGAIGPFTLSKYTKGHMGTQGYYLTPNAAERLIRYGDRWFQPVDLYMDAFWHHHLECFGIEPPVVIRNNILSTRGSSTRKDLRPKEKLSKELSSMRSGLYRRVHNLAFRLRHLSRAAKISNWR